MKEKKFLILSIVLLFLMNVFTLVNFFQYKKQAVCGTLKGNIEKDELFTYEVNFATNILNSNFYLDSIMVKDSLNNMVPLKNAFESGQKQMLVCRFSQMHCESCVNLSIQIMNKWIDSIGIENVLFLGDYRNNRIFNRTKPLYGIQNMKVYNVSTFNIPAEELGYPYYFVLDSSLQISNVFVPDKATPNITNKYLENMHKKLKKKILID